MPLYARKSKIDLGGKNMNLVSALDFALSALNFGLMIWSISQGGWAFAINLAAGVFCLFMGIVALDE
jgi:hypothetical protein